MIKNREEAIFTIPNIMSIIRIILIIPFIYIYFQERYVISTVLLLLSGLTDAIDGFIARKFNMISNLGKILDPLADKITQIAVVVCLTINHTMLLPLLIVFAIKELFMLLGATQLLKEGKRPAEAKWWGKVSTVVVYVMLTLMLLSDIFPTFFPNWAIITGMVVTGITILFSLFNYFVIFLSIQNGTYDIAKESHNKEEVKGD